MEKMRFKKFKRIQALNIILFFCGGSTEYQKTGHCMGEGHGLGLSVMEAWVRLQYMLVNYDKNKTFFIYLNFHKKKKC